MKTLRMVVAGLVLALGMFALGATAQAAFLNFTMQSGDRGQLTCVPIPGQNAALGFRVRYANGEPVGLDDLECKSWEK